MPYKYFLFAFFIFFTFNSVQAQIDNSKLSTEIPVTDSMEHHLMLSISNINFLKNNEYFNDIVTGYTLFGTQLATQIAYQPSRYARIQGGIFLHKDYGNPQLTKVAPLLTLKLEKNNYALLFGNLEANFAHRVIEPLYDYERSIFNPVESGIQFKVKKEKIWSDTWFNWEVMQYLHSTYQEQFTVGHSSDIVLYHKNKWQFKMPVQAIITHKGGQIDVDTSDLKTLLNLASGLSFRYVHNGFLQELKSENYIALYRDLSPNPASVFRSGKGLFLNASAKFKQDITLSFGYWNGQNYLSSRGGKLFLSAASDYGKQGYVEKNRSLFLIRALYQKQIADGLSADVRFEPFIDLNKHTFEYAYSFYLTYHFDFNVAHLHVATK